MGIWFLIYMAKTHFENLQVYKLSEDLADEIWGIVATWDHLAKRRLGPRMFDLQIVSALIWPKEADAGVIRTIGVSYEYQEGRYMKPGIG